MSESVAARLAGDPADPTEDARALVRLFQCRQCSLLLRTPVCLPCGNTICRQCLPAATVHESILFVPSEPNFAAITCPISSCGRLHAASDCSVSVVLSKIMDSVVANISRFQEEASPGSTMVEEIIDKLSAAEMSSVNKESLVQASDTVKEFKEEVEDHDNVEGLEVETDANSDTNKEDPNVEAETHQQDRQQQEKASDEKGSNQAKLQGHASSWPWGRFLASFASAQAGELRYTSDALYYDDNQDPKAMEKQDRELLGTLKDASQRELDCYVCYNVMLDPVTTPCGHAFCRDCLRRNLDHSRHCPICRRHLSFPVSLESLTSDKSLNDLLYALYPEKIAARIEAAREEDASAMRGMETALFVCTMSFPTMPTYLHIFEPRYRLMIRRALEANGQFGMVCYNEASTIQGVLGQSQFCEYGTMLQIERYQLLADGRSFVQCRGVHRFRILEHGSRDGYMIGRVQRIDDISAAEQEELELRDLQQPPPPPPSEATSPEAAAAAYLAAAGPSIVPGRIDLDRTPTAELMRRCLEFVEQSRRTNPPWLRGRILEAYGEPPQDAETFPYWFASVLPLQDNEKYRLLPLTSTRERLKIAMFWIQTIQSERWFQERRCPVL